MSGEATMTTNPPLMRDAFIDTIYEAAGGNPDIYFISADFGAKALDAFRSELPGQFIHAGICEQNMVDLGAGLALSGKAVFLYAMAPFLTTRCYEQIKAVLTSMRLPVTMVAVGVGLGYDHATLTHFTPEDMAIMRALNGVEVVTPADAVAAAAIARDAVARPALRYVRLERVPCPTLYPQGFDDVLGDGFAVLAPGRDLMMVACGIMTHTALAARQILAGSGIDAGVIDLFRIKPLDAARLLAALGPSGRVLTVEEQMLDGGFGSAVGEMVLDAGISARLRRVGIRDGFEVANGRREDLHRMYRIAVEDVVAAAEAMA